MKVKNIKINHSYQLIYEPVKDFKYQMYDDVIGVVSYEPFIESQIPYVIEKLNKNKDSRQAIITVNNPDHMSCLISIQFQIYKNELIGIVSLRSQAVEYTYSDGMLFNYVTTRVLKGLKSDFTNRVKIFVNVGNYHRLTKR